MKITSTMALAAVSAICAVSEVNAQTNDMRNGEVVDGLDHHFKGGLMKDAVSSNLHSITEGSNVDGVALSKVYAEIINVNGSHDTFNGEDYHSPELQNEHSHPLWCHQRHALYVKYSKHHHWRHW